jgi:hypothetical protein
MVADLTGAGGGEDFGINRVISRQLLLTVLNVRQQVTQEHSHPGRVLWVP